MPTLTSPITGGAQTGFTSPTYTHVTDQAPGNNGKQVAVSAIGGTQAGVTVHSVASPFTITIDRPSQLKTLGQPNPVTGRVNNVGRNVYNVRVRKGVLPLANQPYQVLIANASLSIPAGSDAADPSNVRAAISALVGALNQISAGLGDTAVTGTI
jgi:hypothetical protein